MEKENTYIRFDWAMKRLLRNKANFGVLEGFLTTLLGKKMTIRNLLESESNECSDSIIPIQKELDETDNRCKTLRKAHEGKKAEEIPAGENDELNELDKRLTTLKQQKETILKEFASKNKVIRQLIDLALLQNGMLKGEALNNFLKRSIELIKQ